MALLQMHHKLSQKLGDARVITKKKRARRERASPCEALFGSIARCTKTYAFCGYDASRGFCSITHLSLCVLYVKKLLLYLTLSRKVKFIVFSNYTVKRARSCDA